MKFGHWSVALSALALAACGDTLSDPLVLQGGGNYTYEAFAPSGARILEGTIHLEWPPMPAVERADTPIVGTWSIHWVPGADQRLVVGAQVGEGALVGLVGEDGLTLNLNPANADDNVFLHAVVNGNVITGRWTWSTIAGPSTEGRFTAVPGR